MITLEKIISINLDMLKTRKRNFRKRFHLFAEQKNYFNHRTVIQFGEKEEGKFQKPFLKNRNNQNFNTNKEWNLHF